MRDMEQVYLPIGDDDWGIIVNYDCDEMDFHKFSAIMDSFGMSYDEEEAAYTQGELMRQAVMKIGLPCY